MLLNDLMGERITGELEIKGLTDDSRKVRPGWLFICVKGLKSDGHRYWREAQAAGAVAIVAENELDIQSDMTVIKVPDSARARRELAVRFYGNPSRGMKLIGITGTNGKTSTAYITRSILTAAGYRVGLIGTINYMIGEHVFTASHTTPDPIQLQELLAEMKRQGCQYVVMEVSSHSLDQDRVAGCLFQEGVFTNLTRDHLDYHHTMEAYGKAKASLFQRLSEDGKAVVNADDPASGTMIAGRKGRGVIRYGESPGADIRILEFTAGCGRSSLKIEKFGKEIWELESGLSGDFNRYNLAAAVATAVGLGIDYSSIKEGVKTMEPIPGRFEVFHGENGVSVIVDYAHTPDGLDKLLKAAKKICRGNLITVFGCGGDRDFGKRSQMGEIAARFSDLAVITSDNPRTENPLKIIESIKEGFSGTETSNYLVVPDRYQAITQSIKTAEPADVVVIAGKGHEDYQIIGTKKLPFDDREIVKEGLQMLKAKQT
ncbi:MAG: UDP-N-acetylmuramoyl-L-alanyl-D-glutamate--2,6-diaminopimelate ligase [bacterium]